MHGPFAELHDYPEEHDKGRIWEEHLEVPSAQDTTRIRLGSTRIDSDRPMRRGRWLRRGASLTAYGGGGADADALQRGGGGWHGAAGE